MFISIHYLISTRHDSKFWIWEGSFSFTGKYSCVEINIVFVDDVSKGMHVNTKKHRAEDRYLGCTKLYYTGVRGGIVKTYTFGSVG